MKLPAALVIPIILMLAALSLHVQPAAADTIYWNLSPEYIIYDADENESQVCLTLYTRDWYINWSLYELSIAKDDENGYESHRIDLPIGTLAYGEYHYLNATGIVDRSWVNGIARLDLYNSENMKKEWSSKIIVSQGNITNNYTLMDDYDAGQEVAEWPPYRSDVSKGGSLFDRENLLICGITIVVLVVIVLAARYPQWFE